MASGTLWKGTMTNTGVWSHAFRPKVSIVAKILNGGRLQGHERDNPAMIKMVTKIHFTMNDKCEYKQSPMWKLQVKTSNSGYSSVKIQRRMKWTENRHFSDEMNKGEKK